MIVEIDYNNDRVDINRTDDQNMMSFTFHKEIGQVRLLLEELFNLIGPPGVELTLVDEDHRTTLGEW